MDRLIPPVAEEEADAAVTVVVGPPTTVPDAKAAEAEEGRGRVTGTRASIPRPWTTAIAPF